MNQVGQKGRLYITSQIWLPKNIKMAITLVIAQRQALPDHGFKAPPFTA